jgi:ATP-dependent RNA helicase DeaD
MQAIDALGFEQASPIQAMALPILLEKRTDFLGLAATGTGKTAAFAIPMIEKIDPSAKKLQGLIMCPTRELAMQVCEQVNLLGKFKGVKAFSVYGGSGYSEQMRGFKQGLPIVVGTPGRLIDHLKKGSFKPETLETLILDEADEMISMGFKEDLELLLQSCNRDIVNYWLFSATMSSEVKRVAQTYLRDYEKAEVNQKQKLAENIEQSYIHVRERDKPEVLCKIIDNADEFYGLIFCQTKALVVDLDNYLTTKGHRVDCLHGDKSQNDREKTMQAFRKKDVQILVCTDVASRGLDVKEVSHVVNYSLPRELESYVHRVGRTARCGLSGKAISLVTPGHRSLIPRIEKITQSKMSLGEVPSKKQIGAKKVEKFLEQFIAQEDFQRASAHLDERWIKIIKDMDHEEIVGRFLTLLSPDTFQNAPKEKLDFVGPAPRAQERNSGGGRGRRPRSRQRDSSRGDSRRPQKRNLKRA